jgi:hypothetical protein
MNETEKPKRASATASEYINDNFKPSDRIAILVLNRTLGETTQRITTAQKAVSPEFQAWLRYKNANGADIYVGMNSLKQDASTRTKDDIETIRHLYLDLDHGGSSALELIENSDLVPAPNYVLTTSPEKFQVVWKADGITLEEAEALQHAMVREFGGDPAATDSTRVLRLPGFANKKYDRDFYVQASVDSAETYHLRDFKLPIDSQDAPRHRNEERSHRNRVSGAVLSQSEHDWAFAKRALARGDEPEEIIRRIADFRSEDKADPDYYARRTVTQAQAGLEQQRQDPHSSQVSQSPAANQRPDH